MLKSLLIILLSIIAFNFKINAGVTLKEDKNSKRKILYGIFFDELIYLGRLQTRFTLFPFTTYRINDKLLPGAGIKYKYYHTRISSSYAYGTAIFLNYNFLSIKNPALPLRLTMHAEYQPVNTEGTNSNRHWSHLYLAGGGIRQKLSENSFLFVMILWNLRPVNAISEGSEFRLGFTF